MQENNIINKNRIPLKERLDFHVQLGKFMIKLRENEWEKINDEYEKEKTRLAIQNEWEKNYSDLIHRIIDDVDRDDNKIIRPLIMTGKNEQASLEVLKALKLELEKEPENSKALEWVQKTLQQELIHN